MLLSEDWNERQVSAQGTGIAAAMLQFFPHGDETHPDALTDSRIETFAQNLLITSPLL
jgi:hypothetical protein